MWGVVGLAVIVGIIFTVRDYGVWKRLETQYYGQGWKDLEMDALVLDKQIADTKLGIMYKTSSDIRFTKYDLSVREGREGEIGEQAIQIEKPGGRAFIQYKAGKKVDEKIIVLEIEVGEEEWGRWEKTVEAIYNSIQSN